MKCPKCNYVSHDYLDECRKCHIDLLTFKQQLGLLVLKPGILDLSLVLAGAESSSLLDNRMLVETEVAVHDREEDFDISLEDYTDMPADRAAEGAQGTLRPLADHLTLELDTRLTTELSSGVLQGLEDLLPPQPPASSSQDTARRDRGTNSDHLTLELTSQDLPFSLLNTPQPQAMPSASFSSRERSLPIADGEETLSDEFPADLLDDTPDEPTARLPVGPSLAFSPDEPTSQLDISKLRIDTTEEVIPVSEIEDDPEELSFTIPTIEIHNSGAQTIELEDESFDSPAVSTPEVLSLETTHLSLPPLVEEDTPQLPKTPSTATNTSEQFLAKAKTEKLAPVPTEALQRPKDSAEFHLSQTFQELASFEDTDADIELEFPSAEMASPSAPTARFTPGQEDEARREIATNRRRMSDEPPPVETLSLAEPSTEDLDDDFALELPEVGMEEEIESFAPNFDTLDPVSLDSQETPLAGQSTSDTTELRLRQTLQELASDTFDEADLEFEFPSADTSQSTTQEPLPPATSISATPPELGVPPESLAAEPLGTPPRQREKTGELPFERPPAEQPSAPFNAADVARAFESAEFNPLSLDDDDVVGIKPVEVSHEEPDFSAFDMPDLDPTDSNPEHLNLELDTSDLTPELLADTLDETELALEREDAGTASFSLDLQSIAEEVPSFDGLDPALTSLDMPGAMSEEEEMTLGHLTLELDSAEFTEETEQEAATPEEITLAFAEEDAAPLPPTTLRSDMDDELILDLDDLDLDEENRRSS